MPKVSVITPTFNRPDFLALAHSYFAAQTFTDAEWVILDDGPAEIKNPAIRDDPRVRYIYSAAGRQTTGAKRNRLCEEARGEYVVHFDDDDYYAPTYVATALQPLLDNTADWVNLRGFFVLDIRSRFFGYWDLNLTSGLHYRCGPEGVSTLSIEFGEDNVLGWGFGYAYRRVVWEKHAYEDMSVFDDSRFALAAKSDFRLGGWYDFSGLCLHTVHANSSSIPFPQFHLPDFMLSKFFPGLGALVGR